MLAALLPAQCLAADMLGGDWLKIENSHFIGFTNASEEDVIPVMEELEHVRAAVDQAPVFVVPDDRPKTVVLLPSTVDGFRQLAPLPTMAGFAQALDQGAIIVMPVEQAATDSATVARHEFGHTMLFNEWFQHPRWYSEGFAEAVSAIRIDRRDNTYTLGERPARYGRRFSPAIDWNDLVREGFDAHSLGDEELIQSAYAQNWLLFHYVTLDPSANRSLELNRYFGALTTGTTPAEAFAGAFGASPQRLWDTVLTGYLADLPVQTLPFDAGSLDLPFAVTDATDSKSLERLLRYMADKADARRPAPPGPDSLDGLAGQWDFLGYEAQCSDPLEFVVAPDGDVLRIERYYSSDDSEPVPALLLVERVAAGVFELINFTVEEYPSALSTTDYLLTRRGDNVICFDELAGGASCNTVMQRCSAR